MLPLPHNLISQKTHNYNTELGLITHIYNNSPLQMIR